MLGKVLYIIQTVLSNNATVVKTYYTVFLKLLKIETFQQNYFYIFFIIAQCGSNEYPQSMYTPAYPSFTI